MNQDFNSIRAYEDNDLHEVLNRVAQDESFLQVLSSIGKITNSEQFSKQNIIYALQHTDNLNQLDKTIILPLLDKIQQRTNCRTYTRRTKQYIYSTTGSFSNEPQGYHTRFRFLVIHIQTTHRRTDIHRNRHQPICSILDRRLCTR